MITLVYAQDANGGIGYRHQLPWHLPNDLKHFKQVTLGHTMVMGRTTFDGMGQRLLPGRQTIVLSRQADYGKQIEGLQVYTAIEPILALAQEQEVMVIGGTQVFQAFLPYADRMIRTVIEAEFEVDTYMPAIEWDQWRCEQRSVGVVDEKNRYAHTFEWWTKHITE